MGIFHIVMFGFQPDVDVETVKDICIRMVGLKDQCLHPMTYKQYIKSAVGGEDNSTEGHQRGVTHAFVMEFENEEDREYYLEKDPQHLLFVKSLEGKVAIVQVVDFEPGKF